MVRGGGSGRGAHFRKERDIPASQVHARQEKGVGSYSGSVCTWVLLWRRPSLVPGLTTPRVCVSSLPSGCWEHVMAVPRGIQQGWLDSLPPPPPHIIGLILQPRFPQLLLQRGWEHAWRASPLFPRPPTALPPATAPEIPKVCGIIELELLLKDRGR